MDDASLLVQVLNCREQLFEVEARDGLVHPSLLVFSFYEEKQIAFLHQLQHYEEQFVRLSILLDENFTACIVLHKLYYVRVVHRLQEVNFVTQNLLEGRQVYLLYILSVENFYCVKATGFFAFGQLHSDGYKKLTLSKSLCQSS